MLEDFCSIRRTLKHEDCMCEAFEKTVQLIAWRCYFFQHLIKFETWRLHLWSLNRNDLFTNFAEVLQWSLSRKFFFTFAEVLHWSLSRRVCFHYFCRCIRNSNKIHEKFVIQLMKFGSKRIMLLRSSLNGFNYNWILS